MASLRFQREYYHVRPHEALLYETPASRYVGSERRYPAKLPELEYPEGAHLRRVSHHGDVKRKGVQMFVSSLLAWEVVGLLEVEQDPNWPEVYYGPLIIGWMDLRKLTRRLLRHCGEWLRTQFAGVASASACTPHGSVGYRRSMVPTEAEMQKGDWKPSSRRSKPS